MGVPVQNMFEFVCGYNVTPPIFQMMKWEKKIMVLCLGKYIILLHGQG
jgi:hypothetical protein